MNDYIYSVGVLTIGVTSLLLVYAAQTHSSKRVGKRRPWFHYLLLWPLVLDADKDKRNGHFLTTREWVGWAIVGVIVVLAVAFEW